jgi:hypothetical protein
MRDVVEIIGRHQQDKERRQRRGKSHHVMEKFSKRQNGNYKKIGKCSKCGYYDHNSRTCQIQESDTSYTAESNESDVDLEEKELTQNSQENSTDEKTESFTD